MIKKQKAAVLNIFSTHEQHIVYRSPLASQYSRDIYRHLQIVLKSMFIMHFIQLFEYLQILQRRRKAVEIGALNISGRWLDYFHFHVNIEYVQLENDIQRRIHSVWEDEVSSCSSETNESNSADFYGDFFSCLHSSIWLAIWVGNDGRYLCPRTWFFLSAELTCRSSLELICLFRACSGHVLLRYTH